MRKEAKGQKIDTIFVLIIFCVFAMSILIVLMFSANTYKNMTELSQKGYDESTCLSYVWTKVKNGDGQGNVYLGNFQDISALCLDEEYDGITYQTMIYFYDGWVRELFCEKGLEFSPENGLPIMQAESLILEQSEDGPIKVTSGYASLMVYPRGGTERRRTG